MATRGFDLPSLSPSPRVQINRRRTRAHPRDHSGVDAKIFAEDDKIIVAHFEPITVPESRCELTALGITSEYHVQELANSALVWLFTDDFSGYDPDRGIPFRYFFCGVIHRMALRLRRDLMGGILPRGVSERFEYHYRKMRGDDCQRATPELSSAEACQLNLDILATYMKQSAKPQEIEFINALMFVYQEAEFDSSSRSIAKKLAAVTGWSVAKVRKVKSRMHHTLLDLREEHLRQALD